MTAGDGFGSVAGSVGRVGRRAPWFVLALVFGLASLAFAVHDRDWPQVWAWGTASLLAGSCLVLTATLIVVEDERDRARVQLWRGKATGAAS